MRCNHVLPTVAQHDELFMDGRSERVQRLVWALGAWKSRNVTPRMEHGAVRAEQNGEEQDHVDDDDDDDDDGGDDDDDDDDDGDDDDDAAAGDD
eukprot:s759_g4.t1